MELINTHSNKSITPFNGEKYNIWKSRVRALIDETIMDGSALRIIDDENCPMDIEPSDWQIWNKIAKGVIIRSLGDSVVSYATNDPSISARGIFLKLDEIYSRKSVATELSMEIKLQALKYDSAKPLSTHFMIFDELVTDMEAASGDRLKESNKIARLLSTLPKSFAPLIVAIQTLNDKDLNLAFIKTRLLDHEVQLNDEVKDTSSKVLHVNVHKHNNKFKHNKNKTFKNNNYKRKEFGKCHHCGRKGHFKKDCYFYKRGMQQQQQVQENKIVQTANAGGYGGFAFMVGHQTLNANKKTAFIMDSGASDHIINNIDMFQQYVNLTPPVKISIAKNDAKITATKRGVVNLMTNTNQTIILEDVLYCEEVPYNLLSVQRMHRSGMSVAFYL